MKLLGGILKTKSGCRACSSEDLINGIDLGKIPVAGKLTKEPITDISRPETLMKVCTNCGLGQLSVDLDPSDLYVDYNWRTSTSKSYLDYIHSFANDQIIPVMDDRHKWFLEIASNDGYLLTYLQRRGVEVLGIDPSKNISRYAITQGSPVLTEFFDLNVAKDIKRIKGSPHWILANNVLAHTPDINSFMAGIAHLCSDKTTVTIENPTILNILTKNQFETIFHEHYSYLGANSVKRLANEHGLRLFKVEKVSPQGGSNRYWLTKSASQAIDPSVDSAIEEEQLAGILDTKSWEIANNTTKASINKFKEKVKALNSEGARVAAYAASAKASTVINCAELSGKDIICIADDVEEKQDRYIPGTDIQVVTQRKLLSLRPTDIVIFAHNIKEELERNLRVAGYTGNIWIWND